MKTWNTPLVEELNINETAYEGLDAFVNNMVTGDGINDPAAIADSAVKAFGTGISFLDIPVPFAAERTAHASPLWACLALISVPADMPSTAPMSI